MCNRSTTRVMWAIAVVIGALLAGCGDEPPKVAPKDYKPRGGTAGQSGGDAAAEKEFVASVKAGGKSWTSADSATVAGQAITNGGYLMIRPMRDEPIKRPPPRPLGPRNPNLTVALEAMPMSGKTLAREAGKIKTYYRVELEAEGRSAHFDGSTMIGGSGVQRFAATFAPKEEWFPESEGTIRIYIADPATFSTTALLWLKLGMK